MEKKRIMMLLILVLIFCVGTVLIFNSYFFVKRKIEKKHVKTATEQQKEKKRKKENQESLWKHQIFYKGKSITLPCKYSEIKKTFVVKDFNRVRGNIILSDGSSMYLMTGYMGEDHSIPANGDDFDVYGLLVDGKKVSIGGIKVGMTQKRVIKQIGLPVETKDKEWLYGNPDSVNENDTYVGEYFVIMFKDKKVYTMEFYNDNAVSEEIQ